jgi:hypothetical protein
MGTRQTRYMTIEQIKIINTLSTSEAHSSTLTRRIVKLGCDQITSINSLVV